MQEGLRRDLSRGADAFFSRLAFCGSGGMALALIEAYPQLHATVIDVPRVFHSDAYTLEQSQGLTSPYHASRSTTSAFVISEASLCPNFCRPNVTTGLGERCVSIVFRGIISCTYLSSNVLSVC
jgi:hypothetical protein